MMPDDAESVSCTTCRKRKIKCDRSRGGCYRCKKLGEICSYSSGDRTHVPRELSSDKREKSCEDHLTEAGLKRRRAKQSCTECKKAKARCSGIPTCQRCNKRDLSCTFNDCSNTGTFTPERPRSVDRDLRPVTQWLFATELPDTNRIRQLVDQYFSHVHSVRCLGFIHIPTFMRSIEEGFGPNFQGNALVYAICALGAPFYLSKLLEEMPRSIISSIQYSEAGKGWASVAQRLLFCEFGATNINALMTEILLHDYYLRVGDYAQAFFISGMIGRHVQVLQLNIEYDNDILCKAKNISWASKESRRRLMWACFLLDSFIECGIDQLRMVNVSDIEVQLPCLEELFIRNVPCLTQTIQHGQILSSLDQALVGIAVDNLDMRAYYIRLMAIRAKMLRYVKHLEGEIPWNTENSQFSDLDNELRQLERSLPQSLIMSVENSYIYKGSGRLNLFYGLHITICLTYHDLYRVGVDHLVFPNSATQWIRENAPSEFIKLCYRTCAEKAMQIALLLQDLWKFDKISLVDIPYAAHAELSSNVLITCLMTWKDPSPLLTRYGSAEYANVFSSNVKVLRYLGRFLKSDVYYESALRAQKTYAKAAHRDIVLASAESDESCSQPSEYHDGLNGSRFSLEYILNPLGTYPMARKEALERQNPDEDQQSSSHQSQVPSLQTVEDFEYGIFANPILQWMNEAGNGISHSERNEFTNYLDSFVYDNII